MPRFRADLQLSRAGADTPEKEHKKAFGYEAAFKAPHNPLSHRNSRTASLAAKIQHRGVEQLVARRAHNPKVVGSSPASATITGH